MTPNSKPTGFTEWNGGENPVPGQRVAYILRETPNDICDRAGFPSEELIWKHPATPEFGGAFDIIAYRVVSPAPPPPSSSEDK